MTDELHPLHPRCLATNCSPRQFDFENTRDLVLKEDMVGQERAIEAIEYGLDINHKGYNIYVMGSPGLGKHALAKKLVVRKSRLRETAEDWCYVYNFDYPGFPNVLRLPKGQGAMLQKDMAELIRKLQQGFSESVAKDATDVLKKKYTTIPEVLAYLNSVTANIIAHEEEFISKPKKELLLFDQPLIEVPPYSRLKVNLLVDNQNVIGSPVIFEDNPIYHNLTGRVENMSINGSHVSDFTLIKPGSLHRANNGYLILDAYEVLRHHLAWEGLKRALHTQEIRIQPLEQSIEFWSSQTLEPKHIPLDVKVVLIGDRETYYKLCEHEPDFEELFKVVADFEDDMPRNKTNHLRYAKMIANFSNQDELLPLSKKAVAKVIDFGSRLVEDGEKMSLHMHSIRGLVQQADYWARKHERDVVEKEDVQKAISQNKKRLDREQVRLYEEILRNDILIDTSGAKVGQINALSVLEVGYYEFAQPSRITASVHLGDGTVLDIERETDRGGPSHTKGVLILSGYLRSRFGSDELLPLSASIVFEQTYSSIHGDSASAAELASLLSAISGVPIKQSLAITGSVNQKGELQSVGLVNEKIEGFFAICKKRGFTGDHGVIIPATNVKNLMLSDDVISAARKGLFSIYAAEHIDDAMELLTNLTMGRRVDGEYEEETLNRKVDDCLKKHAKQKKTK